MNVSALCIFRRATVSCCTSIVFQEGGVLAVVSGEWRVVRPLASVASRGHGSV
jgi:hypothetical protein